MLATDAGRIDADAAAMAVLRALARLIHEDGGSGVASVALSIDVA